MVESGPSQFESGTQGGETDGDADPPSLFVHRRQRPLVAWLAVVGQQQATQRLTQIDDALDVMRVQSPNAQTGVSKPASCGACPREGVAAAFAIVRVDEELHQPQRLRRRRAPTRL